MAFASVGSMGSVVTPKSDGTTSVLTAAATAEVGNVVAIMSAWDNEATVDGETSQLSLADSAGNTWIKVAEYTRTTGAANAGVCVALWVCVVTTQIDSGSDTFTVTSTSSRTAKATHGWEYTIDASEIAVEDYTVDGADSGDPPAVTLSGLTSREYLLLHVGAEGRGATWTEDGDYTERFDIETTGGGAASNVNLWMADRIATLTGDTADPASNADQITAEILAAVYEVTATVEALAADVDGSGSVTAALDERVQLASSTLGVGTVTASLFERVNLAASTLGAGSVTADLGGTEAGVESLAAAVLGVGTVTGQLTERVQLAAAAAGVAATTAQLTEDVQLAAAVLGAGVVTGQLTERVSLAAVVVGVSFVNADLTGTGDGVTPTRKDIQQIQYWIANREGGF